MHVAWIGGVETSENQLRQAAEAMGHTFELHPGHTTHGIDVAVSRADVVVVITGVNSHRAVHEATRQAKVQKKPCIFAKRPSLSLLRRVLARPQ